MRTKRPLKLMLSHRRPYALRGNECTCACTPGFTVQTHGLTAPSGGCAIRLRLTPSEPEKKGSAFVNYPVPVLQGFTSEFSFQISDQTRTCYTVKDRSFSTRHHESWCVTIAGSLQCTILYPAQRAQSILSLVRARSLSRSHLISSPPPPPPPHTHTPPSHPPIPPTPTHPLHLQHRSRRRRFRLCCTRPRQFDGGAWARRERHGLWWNRQLYRSRI